MTDKALASELTWLIGGLDPSGGAGLLADSRLMQAYNGRSQVIMTCMTYQSHRECRRIEAVRAADIRDQIEVLLAEEPPTAIKIGMLPNATIIKAVASAIKDIKTPKD